MRKVAFLPRGFDEFNLWAVEDKKIYAKIVSLIKDIHRNPFSRLGKPEALKHNLSGYPVVLQMSIAWLTVLQRRKLSLSPVDFTISLQISRNKWV